MPAYDVGAWRRSHGRPQACEVTNLVVIGFADANEAERVLADLQKRSMIFEDAVIVRRNGNGRPHLKRNFRSGGSANLRGAMWGSLVALPFLNPLVGLAIGAALGPGGMTRSNKPARYRIRDDAVRSIAAMVQPNTSALAILTRDGEPAKMLAELPLHVRGWVIRSSYSPEDEARLTAALSGDTDAMPPKASTQSTSSMR